MKLFLILLFMIVLIQVNSLQTNFNVSNNILSNFLIDNVYGQSNPSNTQTEYISYKNQKYGFTVEYPSYWIYKENNFYTSDNTELVNFVSSPNTQISISRYENNEFKNLSDQQYLDKMNKKYETECDDSSSKYGITCSDFQSLMSTVDPSGKYLSYVVSYTYTEKSASHDAIDKSKLIIQIPDHDYIWNITIISTSDDLPNHLEEITSSLNSFTILSEPKDVIPSPSVQTNPNSKKGGGCLIATATYGSELAPQVQQLRELRDNQLLQTESGTSFMSSFNDIYYSFSPTIADWERENPTFKEFVKITLTPMIFSLSILNYVDMDSDVSVLGYGISLIILNIGMYFVAPAIVIHTVRRRIG